MKTYFTIFTLILSIQLYAQSDSSELEELDIGGIDIESILHPSNHDLIDWDLQKDKADDLITIANKLNGLWVLDGQTSTDRKKDLKVIEFNFEKSTKGSYDDYNDYDPNREWQTINTCQPIPEIVFHNSKFQILFTGMAGDSLQEFRIINDRELIFIGVDNTTKHYTRLTK